MNNQLTDAAWKGGIWWVWVTVLYFGWYVTESDAPQSNNNNNNKKVISRYCNSASPKMRKTNTSYSLLLSDTLLQRELNSKRDPRSFYPLLPLVPRDILYLSTKSPSYVTGWESFTNKSCKFKLSRDRVQQLMHWTFMQLVDALPMPLFYCYLILNLCGCLLLDMPKKLFS